MAVMKRETFGFFLSDCDGLQKIMVRHAHKYNNPPPRKLFFRELFPDLIQKILYFETRFAKMIDKRDKPQNIAFQFHTDR
jgi:hypothetical protein